MSYTRWTGPELARLPALAAAGASDAELIAALPRHTAKAIRSRMAERGLWRPSTTRPSPKERQRLRMAKADNYLAKRVAQLGPAAFTRAAERIAGAAALECLIVAAVNIQARRQVEEA